MIAYKLTAQDMTTHNGFKWTLGKREEIVAPGNELRSKDVFHFYDTPEIAVLMNPTHGRYDNPRIFRCECDEVAHDGTKGGAKRLTLLEEILLPKITAEQRVAFCIYCALEVYTEPKWVKWAKNWLSGKDRTSAAATAAAAAATAAHAVYAEKRKSPTEARAMVRAAAEKAMEIK